MPRGGKRIYKQVGGEIEEEAARTGDTREDGGSGRLEGASEEERVEEEASSGGDGGSRGGSYEL